MNELDTDEGIVLSWVVLCNGSGLGPGGTIRKVELVVRPTSQNPYPIYDQNVRFLLPYLWPFQKFDILFMIDTRKELLVTILLIMMKK